MRIETQRPTRPVNIQASPVVALISYPERWYNSIVWALRRIDNSFDDSDTLIERGADHKIGAKDADLVRNAIRSGKLWALAGGSFHFTISNLPLITILSLAMTKHGTVVYEAPSSMQFECSISPIGLSKSAVFNLGSLIDRIGAMHRGMRDAGAHPFQLLEILPCGTAVDCEFMISGENLMRLMRSALCHSAVERFDLLFQSVVYGMLKAAQPLYPVVFCQFAQKCPKGCTNCQ